jgi:DNA-binding response OmpR family regulator
VNSKKVLITEDSSTIRGMLKDIFESEGYSVITAEDGFEGLNKARSEGPDLIVLDLMLPKMDGFKVCRMLKFDDHFKEIPILMLTARSSSMDKEMGEAVGADAYLVKPFEIDELLEQARALIGE